MARCLVKHCTTTTPPLPSPISSSSPNQEVSTPGGTLSLSRSGLDLRLPRRPMVLFVLGQSFCLRSAWVGVVCDRRRGFCVACGSVVRRCKVAVHRKPLPCFLEPGRARWEKARIDGLIPINCHAIYCPNLILSHYILRSRRVEVSQPDHRQNRRNDLSFMLKAPERSRTHV